MLLLKGRYIMDLRSERGCSPNYCLSVNFHYFPQKIFTPWFKCLQYFLRLGQGVYSFSNLSCPVFQFRCCVVLCMSSVSKHHCFRSFGEWQNYQNLEIRHMTGLSSQFDHLDETSINTETVYHHLTFHSIHCLKIGENVYCWKKSRNWWEGLSSG